MIFVRLLSMALIGAAGFQQPASVSAARSPAQISFKFERPVAGVPVRRYTIALREDGTGAYQAELPVPQSAEGQTIERPLTFTPESVKSAFDWIQQVRSSDVPCASKLKHIADTGTKTLTYSDGTCSYNYSENKAVVQLTGLFQQIECTLEEGRALDFKHRFDRLGLDAEIASLTDAVESGRAIELGNIAPTLRSIAGDTELIQRVRLRAAKLLERTQAGS